MSNSERDSCQQKEECRVEKPAAQEVEMADAFTNKRLRDRSLKKEHTVFVSCKKTSKGKWPTRHKPGKESATSEDQGREDERLEFGLRNSPCTIQGLPSSRYKTTYQHIYDQEDYTIENH